MKDIKLFKEEMHILVDLIDKKEKVEVRIDQNFNKMEVALRECRDDLLKYKEKIAGRFIEISKEQGFGFQKG